MKILRMSKRRFPMMLSGTVILVLTGCGTSSPSHQDSIVSRSGTNASASRNVTNRTNSSGTSNATSTNAESATNAGNSSTVIGKEDSGSSSHPLFQSIDMVDATKGWALGKRTVWYTTDGGGDWHNVTPKNLPADSNLQINLGGLDSLHAVLGVNVFGKKGLTVYQTVNEGRSWKTVKLKEPGIVHSFQFLDEVHGFMTVSLGAATGSEGEAIYRTDSGGLAWKQVATTHIQSASGVPFGGDKTGSSFISTNEGWITGFEPMNGNIYFYQTTDGGEIWKKARLQIPSRFRNAQFTSFPPQFFNNHDGVLPVIVEDSPQDFLLYRTQDGGQHWSPMTPLPSSTKAATFGAKSFPDKNCAFVVNGEKLDATRNDGQTWRPITANISFSRTTYLDFISATDGWVLMQSGTLYHTTDGGHVWRKVS